MSNKRGLDELIIYKASALGRSLSVFCLLKIITIFATEDVAQYYLWFVTDITESPLSLREQLSRYTSCREVEMRGRLYMTLSL